MSNKDILGRRIATLTEQLAASQQRETTVQRQYEESQTTISVMEKDYRELLEKYTTSQQENAKLREALEEYGRHLSSCPVSDWCELYPCQRPKCDCGFDAALAATKGGGES